MKDILNGKISAVKISKRLKNHPVCLSNEGDLSIEMEKVLNQMPNAQGVKADKVLEVNANHEVFKALKDAYENDKPAKADTGRGGIRGGGTEPVCVCGVLPFIRG